MPQITILLGLENVPKRRSAGYLVFLKVLGYFGNPAPTKARLHISNGSCTAVPGRCLQMSAT